MHLSVAIPRVQLLDSIIDIVDRVCLELDLDMMASPKVQSSFMISCEASWLDYFSSHQLSRIRRTLLRSFGLDVEDFRRLHPLVLLNQLSGSSISQTENYSIDQSIWNKAKTLNKQTSGLEKVEEQMAVLNTMGLNEMAKGIGSIAKNTSKFRKLNLKMSQAYRQEDVQRLYQLAKKSIAVRRGLLLKERNFRMAERIHQGVKSSDKATLYAIGAGHLMGKNGVINLLRKKAAVEINPVL